MNEEVVESESLTDSVSYRPLLWGYCEAFFGVYLFVFNMHANVVHSSSSGSGSQVMSLTLMATTLLFPILKCHCGHINWCVCMKLLQVNGERVSISFHIPQSAENNDRSVIQSLSQPRRHIYLFIRFFQCLHILFTQPCFTNKKLLFSNLGKIRKF